MNRGRLYLRRKLVTESGYTSSSSPSPNETSTSSSSEGRNNGLRCYEIFWQSINPDFKLKDCYSLGGVDRTGGHFYGGGEIPGSDHWPLNKTSVPYSPFLTGSNKADSGWGRTLGRFFVNSEGAAIQITGKIHPAHALYTK
jgi:hypothetical protein